MSIICVVNFVVVSILTINLMGTLWKAYDMVHEINGVYQYFGVTLSGKYTYY
jgi:hypothetical protein